MERNRVCLSHMRDAIAKIERHLAGADYEAFTGHDMMIDAVIRELEIIDEAARNLSASFVEEHPDIPWSRIERMRILSVVRHGVFSTTSPALFMEIAPVGHTRRHLPHRMH